MSEIPTEIPEAERLIRLADSLARERIAHEDTLARQRIDYQHGLEMQRIAEVARVSAEQDAHMASPSRYNTAESPLVRRLVELGFPVETTAIEPTYERLGTVRLVPDLNNGGFCGSCGIPLHEFCEITAAGGTGPDEGAVVLNELGLVCVKCGLVCSGYGGDNDQGFFVALIQPGFELLEVLKTPGLVPTDDPEKAAYVARLLRMQAMMQSGLARVDRLLALIDGGAGIPDDGKVVQLFDKGRASGPRLVAVDGPDGSGPPPAA